MKSSLNFFATALLAVSVTAFAPGGGPAMIDLMSGQVNLLFASVLEGSGRIIREQGLKTE